MSNDPLIILRDHDRPRGFDHMPEHAAAFWDAVVHRARAWRVSIATWLVLALTAELFGLADVRAAGCRLQPSAARRRLLARLTGPGAILRGQDITHSRWRLVYQLVLVDRPQDAVRLVWRALWPEEAWLTARYGAATPGIRARHLLTAARGRM